MPPDAGKGVGPTPGYESRNGLRKNHFETRPVGTQIFYSYKAMYKLPDLLKELETWVTPVKFLT